MVSWRNWLAQESYTFKVGGSSPSLPTMKETISDFYKEKGFNVVYINTNKEPRRVATLRRERCIVGAHTMHPLTVVVSYPVIDVNSLQALNYAMFIAHSE